jgi:hypothetical protein
VAILGDKTNPHCSVFAILFGKIYNHDKTQCSHKDKLARAHAAFISETANKASQNYFILDSGTSSDMSPNAKILFDYVPFAKPMPVMLGDGSIDGSIM